MEYRDRAGDLTTGSPCFVIMFLVLVLGFTLQFYDIEILFDLGNLAC